MQIFHESIAPSYTVAKFHNLSRGFDHWHKRMEFILVLEGTCKIKVGKNSRICQKGDLAVIQSGDIHAISEAENSILYICTFDSSILFYFQSDIQYIRVFITAAELANVGIDGRLNEIFEEMYTEKCRDAAWGDVMIRADIVRLYSLLVRHFRRETTSGEQSLVQFQNFQNALQYIADNYRENITLADIARVTNYNPVYVSTLFVTYTGVNFKTYLDSFRINQAVKLAKGTDLTFTDISAKCGFDNIRTFNNVFKRITGMTPSQLRKTNI